VDAYSFTIEPSGFTHRADVLRLLAELLPGTDVSARYSWMYEKNPHGRAITVVAFDAQSKEALGVASVFPRRLITAGRMFLGAMGGDAFVKPTARRRGVATAMHRALYERMKNEGVEVMFGPPVPNNLKALERAGSRVISNVCRYVRPGWVHAALRPFGRSNAGRSLRLQPFAEDERQAEVIFERMVQPTQVMAVRDAAFFRWRFAENPARVQRAFIVKHEQRAIGLCVLEQKDKRMAIVDLVAPKAEYARVIQAAISATDATSFVLQLNEEGPFADELRLSGLWPRERKPFQVLATTNREPNFFDASRWYYTWGDGDLDQVL
jgi:GNAT superfamily N-acetyltransferase